MRGFGVCVFLQAVNRKTWGATLYPTFFSSMTTQPTPIRIDQNLFITGYLQSQALDVPERLFVRSEPIFYVCIDPLDPYVFEEIWMALVDEAAGRNLNTDDFDNRCRDKGGLVIESILTPRQPLDEEGFTYIPKQGEKVKVECFLTITTSPDNETIFPRFSLKAVYPADDLVDGSGVPLDYDWSSKDGQFYDF